MARDVKKDAATDTQASNVTPIAEGASNGAAATTEAAATAPAGRELIQMKDPDTGAQISRKDLILKLADKGLSRSAITKELQKQNPKIRYQIVFQATKSLTKEQYPNLRGGQAPKPEAAASTSTAPAVEGAAS
jgi:hypothetical protein